MFAVYGDEDVTGRDRDADGKQREAEGRKAAAIRDLRLGTMMKLGKGLSLAASS
jgi:hypothetical protein